MEERQRNIAGIETVDHLLRQLQTGEVRYSPELTIEFLIKKATVSLPIWMYLATYHESTEPVHVHSAQAVFKRLPEDRRPQRAEDLSLGHVVECILDEAVRQREGSKLSKAA